MSQSLEAMGRLPLFKSLEPKELAVLQHYLRIRRLDPLDTLFREGAPALSCFVVLVGSIDVYKALPEGKDEHLATVQAGGLLGHMALVDKKPRSATCGAGIEGARLLELGRDEFERLFTARSTFAFKILDQVAIDLAGRLRDANDRLVRSRRSSNLKTRRAAARAAGADLHGFDVPESIHGVDLTNIRVEASLQDRRVKDDRR